MLNTPIALNLHVHLPLYLANHLRIFQMQDKYFIASQSSFYIAHIKVHDVKGAPTQKYFTHVGISKYWDKISRLRNQL